MSSWIETEDKSRLINADKVTLMSAEDNAYGQKIILAHFGDHLLSSSLCVAGPMTETQAGQVINHLSLWLPAATPGTIRMSELMQSVKGSRKGAE